MVPAPSVTCSTRHLLPDHVRCSKPEGRAASSGGHWPKCVGMKTRTQGPCGSQRHVRQHHRPQPKQEEAGRCARITQQYRVFPRGSRAPASWSMDRPGSTAQCLGPRVAPAYQAEAPAGQTQWEKFLGFLESSGNWGDPRPRHKATQWGTAPQSRASLLSKLRKPEVLRSVPPTVLFSGLLPACSGHCHPLWEPGKAHLI